RLTIEVRVLRDQQWRITPARDLVPDDIIRLRVGDMIPADLKLLVGDISADQSALTGEAMPREIEAGGTLYASSIVRRGEGIAVVTGIGTKTFYGKTARLVQTAKSTSHGEQTIQEIVKYLMILNVLLVVAMVIYSSAKQLPLADAVPFILI